MTASIDSRRFWNDTGITVEQGISYTFEVARTDTWKDWTKTCTAEGYEASSLAWFNKLRRLPGANWFALVGTIDRDQSSAFVIGCSLQAFRAPKSGQLSCFANDVPFMYWNNNGVVTLSVRMAQ